MISGHEGLQAVHPQPQADVDGFCGSCKARLDTRNFAEGLWPKNVTVAQALSPL